MKCSRCSSPQFTTTRGEHFCSECYHNFVTRKVRASMGDFRLNGLLKTKTNKHKNDIPTDPPTIVAFCSFGSNSMALVDLLLQVLESQKAKNNGLVGFKLKVVHLRTPGSGSITWPFNDLELSVFDFNTDLNLPRNEKHDKLLVELRKKCFEIAEEMNATAVFGYSLTKLSELTLSLTIKGRGGSIPEWVCPTVDLDKCVYPLRELTNLELLEYLKLRNIEYLQPDTVPGITKMMSIDEIVHVYFEGVQAEFPSVVSTVTRVASKLERNNSTDLNSKRCCGSNESMCECRQ